MTPGQLRTQADALDAEGATALARGDVTGAAALFDRAEEARECADVLERLRAERAPAEHMLPVAEHSATTEPVTAADARGLAISAGKARARKAATGKGDKFLDALAAKKWSLRRYARLRLSVSPSTLSEWRKGVYPVPLSAARLVESDLGLPADGRTWPGGIDDNR